MDFSISEGGLYLIDKSVLTSTIIPLEEENVVQISCGSNHSALVFKSGRVFTFGRNESFQLGLGEGNRTFVLKPTLVWALEGVAISQVACGGAFTLFLSKEGEVYVCGEYNHGQLGLDIKANCPVPTRVDDIPPIKTVAAGTCHSVLVALSGEVFVAGYNHYGQLGLGHQANKTTFTIIPTLRAHISAVSCGSYHTALVTSTGVLCMCGRNSNGELGLGNKTNSYTICPVSLPAPVTSVACGQNHTLALTTDGTVWAWGSKEGGKLGVETDATCLTPQKVVGLENRPVTKLVAGFTYNALITEAGDVLMCGDIHVRLGGDVKLPGAMTAVPKSPRLVVDQVAIAELYTVLFAVSGPECPSPRKADGEILPWEDSIIKVLECPVCFKVMCAPIHQCRLGHSICNSCRSCTTECCVCRQPYSDARNFGLENLGADVFLPCTDCLERLPTNLLERHGSVCPNRSRPCPATTTCAWKGRSPNMLNHLTLKHADRVWQDFPHLFVHENLTGTIETYVLVAHDRVFLLHCKYSETDRAFSVAPVLVGSAVDRCRYKCHLKILGDNDLHSLSVKNTVFGDNQDVEDIFKDSSTIVLGKILCGKHVVCEVDIQLTESHSHTNIKTLIGN